MGNLTDTGVDKARAAKRRNLTRLGHLYKRLGWSLRVAFGAVCLVLPLLVGIRFAKGMAGFSTIDFGMASCSIVGSVVMILPGTAASRFRTQLTAFGIGCWMALGILETYIRVFDPFPILLRAGRIDLPANSRREFKSGGMPGLDPIIHVESNSLGFRGPEPPTPWTDYLTIVCVGGSTTQCVYLSESTTWPDRLQVELSKSLDRVWINNAGIDGHSTFGHLELLEQYLAAMRPKVLLFYVGLNDVDRNDLNQYDASTLRSRSREDDSLARGIQRILLRTSDAFALIDNLRLHWLAKRKGLTHGETVGHQHFATRPQHLTMTNEARQLWLEQRSPDCLSAYRKRLQRLIQRCVEENITCVLLTQPVLYGEGKDDVTGIDLETVRVGEVDGWTHWQLLKQYNQATLEIAKEFDVARIDVATQMPKSSKYFYDLTHYNLEGAVKIAEIIEGVLAKVLKPRFPSFSSAE